MDLKYDQGEYDAMRDSVTEVTIVGMLWGIHLCLSINACRILIKRGIKGSRPRSWQLCVVLLMLSLSTTYLATLWIFSRDHFHANVYATGQVLLGLPTIIFLVSDFIVVWRAWVLWPNSLFVKGILVAVLLFTIGCAPPVLYRVGRSGDLTLDTEILIIPAMIGYFPFLTTNLVATSTVAYKAWLYRSEVQAFLNPSGVASNSSRSHLGRIFLLLIESGAVYTLFWSIYFASFLGPSMLPPKSAYEPYQANTNEKFRRIWDLIMTEVSAMYPAIIIILVSNLMSQNDIVNGSYHDFTPYREQHFPRTAAQRISTLHFATQSAPDVSTYASSRDSEEFRVGESHEGKKVESDELKTVDSIV